MAKIETGGPAFPELQQTGEWSENRGEYQEKIYSESGMTLRDYFAAKALAGLLTANVDICTDNLPDIKPVAAAATAYQMADAMIAARKAQP